VYFSDQLFLSEGTSNFSSDLFMTKSEYFVEILFPCKRRVFFVSSANSLKNFTRTVLNLSYTAANFHLFFLKNKCPKELPGENLLWLAVEERPLSMLLFYEQL
jgi:hypothetical protein